MLVRVGRDRTLAAPASTPQLTSHRWDFGFFSRASSGSGWDASDFCSWTAWAVVEGMAASSATSESHKCGKGNGVFIVLRGLASYGYWKPLEAEGVQMFGVAGLLLGLNTVGAPAPGNG